MVAPTGVRISFVLTLFQVGSKYVQLIDEVAAPLLMQKFTQFLVRFFNDLFV